MKEPLELWRLNFRTFLVMKDTSTNTRTLRMTLSDLPSTEIEPTSIAQPLQLWKLGFRTFLVLKDDCTTSTTM